MALLLGCVPAAGFCQEEEADSIPRTSVDWMLDNTDSLRFLEIEAGPMKFVPFIAPSYTPEMQFLVTAGGLITFSFDRKDRQLLRSSIPFSVGKSTNGSLQVSVKGNLYLREDRFRITGEIWRKDMPDNYYGVGYDNGRNVMRSDTTTAYHRDWRRIYAKVMHQVRPHWFVGGILDATNTDATELNPLMMQDPDVLASGTSTRNRGLGVVMEYDDRDVPVNAYEGMFIGLSFINYGTYMGGQSEFWTVDMDYRQYEEVGHRKVIAWQLHTRTSFGNVPWTEMAQIGTPWDLRGYVWGQYRDELMTYAMVEYRHMFDRKGPGKRGTTDSRFGFATWLGMGGVAEDIAHIPAALPNAGVGIRFETEERSNIRVDYGVGVNSSAFYVTFYEAF